MLINLDNMSLKPQYRFDQPNLVCFFPFPRFGQLQPSSTQPTLCCLERTLSLLTQTQQSASGFFLSTHTHFENGLPTLPSASDYLKIHARSDSGSLVTRFIFITAVKYKRSLTGLIGLK